MVVWKTYLPQRYNNKKPVPKRVLGRLLHRIAARFDGMTIRPKVIGYYRSRKTGRMIVDESIEVEVVCEAADLADARRMLAEFARELKQEVMYFEVRNADVEFIAPD